jgi:hypothetical protein
MPRALPLPGLPNVNVVEMNPGKFYALVKLARSIPKETYRSLDTFSESIEKICEKIDEEADGLARVNNDFLAEVRHTTRRRNPFAGVDDQEDAFADLRHTVSGENFLRVIFDVVSLIQRGFQAVYDTSRGCRPADFVLAKDKKMEGLSKWGHPDAEFDSTEDMQKMLFEFQLNQGSLQRFLDGLSMAEGVKNVVIQCARHIGDKLENYYQTLVKRHSVDGLLIHGDPIATDVAMTIFENVDAHGEIQDGKKPDEVSAYSIRKATIVAEAVKGGLVGGFIKNPDMLLNFVEDNLKTLWQLAGDLHDMFATKAAEAKTILGRGGFKRHYDMPDSEFDQAVRMLRDLDPRSVTFKEKTGLQTPEERFALKFRNETLKSITWRLQNGTTNSLIEYILSRKAELRDYYLEENSFYVCKMGDGNPFTGEAPGSLKVTPGTRPVVNIEEIIGSNFDEVKEFLGLVEASSKWHDLFTALSPSRTADKTNCLLIGPQGCGKSEILRAVGGDKKSIGVFATGSDFLTCWKGEAEKNPKRLFEQCLQLQRESKKHVHILIDEIDTILNKDSGRESFGGTNLVSEFQNLMDGIVHYPHVSVWGATNNPERLPMPILRRFSKVWIVGELSSADRVTLLKHFTSFMPVPDSFSESEWVKAASALEGATGDVIRKIVDFIWREKMGHFVSTQVETAGKALDLLNTDGVKFTIHEFDTKKRRALHKLIGPYVSVTPEDVYRSIDLHLGNVAIHHEIRTAVQTYEKSKSFLASIKKAVVNGDAKKSAEAEAE